MHSDLSLSMDIKHPPSIQPSSQGHYLQLARTLSSERQKASQNEYVERFHARFKQGDSPTTTNPYVESIHSKLTSQPVKARSPVRLRNEYVEMIDAKLSSKRRSKCRPVVRTRTSMWRSFMPSCRQRDPVNIITTGRGRESGSAQHSRR